jgi:hypothetical protein
VSTYRTRHLTTQIELYQRWIRSDRNEDRVRTIISNSQQFLLLTEEEFLHCGKSELREPLRKIGGSYEEFREFLENHKLFVDCRELYGSLSHTAYFRQRTLGLLEFHDACISGLEKLVSDPPSKREKAFGQLAVFKDSGLIDEYVDLIREQLVVWFVVFLELYIREMLRRILHDCLLYGADVNSLLKNWKEFEEKGFSIHKNSDIDRLLKQYSRWDNYKDILSRAFSIRLDNFQRYHFTVTKVVAFRNLLVHNRGIINSGIKKKLQLRLEQGDRFYPDKLFLGNLIGFGEDFADWFDKEVTKVLKGKGKRKFSIWEKIRHWLKRQGL